MTEKRRPGRPRKYTEGVSKQGAPVLRVRLEPDVYVYVQEQPEGARAYLERLVRWDRDGAGPHVSQETGSRRATTQDRPASSVDQVPFPFLDLEPAKLELLIFELVCRARKWQSEPVLIGRTGEGESWEIRAWEKAGRSKHEKLWIIRCEPVTQFGPEAAQRLVDALPASTEEPPAHLILVVPTAISQRTRDTFESACSAAGLETFEFWDATRLRARLVAPSNHDLAERFFGLWLS